MLEEDVGSEAVSGGEEEIVTTPDQGSNEEVSPLKVEHEEVKSVTEKINELAAKSAEKEEVASKPEVASKEKAPEYAPSYTYTAYNKEYTMPEWTKSLIKDKATEDNFRELFSKAEAFEPLKTNHMELKKSYEADSQKWGTVMSRLEEAQYYLDNKELGSFFKRCGVPTEDVIDFVKKHIQYHEMSPDQRSVYDQKTKSVEQNFQAQHQLTDLQKQNAQLMANKHEFEFQQAMALPEVSKFQKLFDSKLGEGAFKKHADSYGEQVWLKSKINPPPLESVQYVMNQYKGLFEAQASEQNIGNNAPSVAQTKPGGVIPNVGRGKAVSPTKKIFTSIDALRKHASSIIESNQANG